jgi:hypothetical protein
MMLAMSTTANQRGGSEWEPIKILPKNSAYEPRSHGYLRKLFLPNPRSHWSAAGPRRKVQPTTSKKHVAENNTNTAPESQNWSSQFSETGQTDSHNQGKPVRLLWQTGQASFV